MRAALRVLSLALVGLMVASASAEGPTQITTAGFQPYQRWLDRAHVPGPVAEVRVYESIAGCSDGGYACTWTDRSPPEIWINSRLDLDLRRGVYLHELGHVAHDQLTLSEQSEFAEIDGEPFALEHFADAFMYCALDHRRWGRELPGPFPSWEPTRSQHRRACALIRSALTS